MFIKFFIIFFILNSLKKCFSFTYTQIYEKSCIKIKYFLKNFFYIKIKNYDGLLIIEITSL